MLFRYEKENFLSHCYFGILSFPHMGKPYPYRYMNRLEEVAKINYNGGKMRTGD